MNVFILCTGRCGSTTLERAFSHLENYTCSHESRANQLGHERLNYPSNHIESDNRLSWFLGRLEEKYGNDAFYIHLKREPSEVARSYAKRFHPGLIMPAYADGIYIDLPPNIEPFKEQVARDYVHTVESNINLFLRDKTNKITVELNEVKEKFPLIWQKIGAKGDYDKAFNELDVRYNYAGSGNDLRPKEAFLLKRILKKTQRIITKIPGFLRNA